MNKKIVVSLLFSFIPFSVHAGFNYTTVHSRANCGNNESITWWLNHSFTWRVVSFHDNNKKGSGYHSLDTGYQYTWRCAAVHWGEATPLDSWFVQGFHYIDDGYRKYSFDATSADDCNIYDGWWDVK